MYIYIYIYVCIYIYIYNYRLKYKLLYSINHVVVGSTLSVECELISS